MTSKAKIGIGIALGVIGGVGFYVYKQLSYAKKLCYSFGGVKVKEASASRVVIDLNYGIKNLDKLDIEVRSLEFDVYVGGKLTTHIEENDPIEIKPFSKTTIPMSLVFSPKDLASDIGSLILGGGYKHIPIKFKGKVRLKKLGIVFSIPFSETYTVRELSDGAGESMC